MTGDNVWGQNKRDAYRMEEPMAEQHNDDKTTGAGSEAAEGLRGANKSAHGDDEERSGSEPLKHRDAEHKSGYGGEKGEPKTSSDQR